MNATADCTTPAEELEDIVITALRAADREPRNRFARQRMNLILARLLNRHDSPVNLDQEIQVNVDRAETLDIIARILRENVDRLDDTSRQRLVKFEEFLRTCPRWRSPR